MGHDAESTAHYLDRALKAKRGKRKTRADRKQGIEPSTTVDANVNHLTSEQTNQNAAGHGVPEPASQADLSQPFQDTLLLQKPQASQARKKSVQSENSKHKSKTIFESNGTTHQSVKTSLRGPDQFLAEGLKPQQLSSTEKDSQRQELESIAFASMEKHLAALGATLRQIKRQSPPRNPNSESVPGSLNASQLRHRIQKGIRLPPSVQIDDAFLEHIGMPRRTIERELPKHQDRVIMAMFESVSQMTPAHLVPPERRFEERKYLLRSEQVFSNKRLEKAWTECHRMHMLLQGMDPTKVHAQSPFLKSFCVYSDGSKIQSFSKSHRNSMSSKENGSAKHVQDISKKQSYQGTEESKSDPPTSSVAAFSNHHAKFKSQHPQPAMQNQISNGSLWDGSNENHRNLTLDSRHDERINSRTRGIKYSIPSRNTTTFAPFSCLPIGHSPLWTNPGRSGPVPPIAEMHTSPMSPLSQGPLNLRNSLASPMADKPWGPPRRVKPLAVPIPTDDYMRLSDMPITRFSKGHPLLIICDLNGTLLCRKRLSTKFTRRPGLEKFLNYLFREHQVMMWTSARRENMEIILDNMLTQPQKLACIGSWARDTLGLTAAQYSGKLQVYKRLETIWASEFVQKAHPDYESGGRWTQKNTIIVDDSPAKTLAQPYNAINVPEFVSGSTSKEEKSSLLKRVEQYVEEARHYDNVSAFIKSRPFNADANLDCYKVDDG